MPAHDQNGHTAFFQRRHNLGQADVRVHNKESSQPRLPWRRYNTNNGCCPSSSSDSGLLSNSSTSPKLALRYISSASAIVLAWPVSKKRLIGSPVNSRSGVFMSFIDSP